MAHIMLYGPPGSGKSTLGRMLADSLHMPFVDLDQGIEARAGRTIPQIMEESGEGAFRDLESSTFCEVLEGTERVIALGGGTLLREANRVLAESRGRVICLRAEAQVLLQRLRAGPASRPLMAGNLEERLAGLLASRLAHYDSFSGQFNSDRPPEKLIPELQVALGRFHLSAMGSYDVTIEEGSLERLGEVLEAKGTPRALVVTDENVARLYSARVLGSLRRSGYDADMLVISPGESSKTLVTVNHLWHGFLEGGLDRKSTVIALGGGVVGDLAGFAASTFMRGVQWVSVPTTVLSMVDASLGGKTGFDLAEGKNLIGSFHAPRLVWADPDVLSSLPDGEFRAGLAEVVKHGIIGDPELFEVCAMGPIHMKEDLSRIVRRAAAVKVSVIEADPYEKGERAALNFGHTVGHAVELASGFRMRHGEAVAIGMVSEAHLAERLGIARPGLSEEIAEVLARLGLPVQIPAELPRPELIGAMQSDKKKAGGQVHFALPAEIGRVHVNVEVKDLSILFEED